MSFYKSLKMSILNGDQSPGEHIRELELSRFFKTSQGPVREALRFIDQDGFILLLPIYNHVAARKI
ncbi:MAG: GntR family transcriptional regulator [Desulfobacterales bacterium]|nr:MAG: GntR family transcriptional regulator [Desulfobacterales bacterium]